MTGTRIWVEGLKKRGEEGYETFFKDKETDRFRLTKTNAYWSRVLVAEMIAGRFKRARGRERERLRKVGLWLLPKEARCYNGHLLPKDTHPHDCPKCLVFRRKAK